jgi:N-acetylmuramoyl-L-alanine amidase
MNPKYITVHTTGNRSAGANALAHANLQYKGNSRTASWHFTCDDKEIYQSIPTNEVGWHAGDGRGPGNMQSIGIEICVNSNGDFEKAKANAIWLIWYLMNKHDIPISRVVPHKHWSGKDCPHEILPTWNVFINQIKSGGSTGGNPR